MYIFNRQPTSEQLNEVSEHFSKVAECKKGANKDYIPIEKAKLTRKKTFIYDFNANATNILGNYLLNIYRQQNSTFKLTIGFLFLRIKVEEDKNVINVQFDLRLASFKTRPEVSKNPIVVDDKKILIKLLIKLQIFI